MQSVTKRFWTGAGWGLVATCVMTAVMFLISTPDTAPFGILLRIVARAVGHPVTTIPVIAIAIAIHLAYGSFWAGFLAASAKRVNVMLGIVLGLGLWFVMMIYFVPMDIGFNLTLVKGFWLSTLVLHLLYGTLVGLLVDHHHRREHPLNELIGRVRARLRRDPAHESTQARSGLPDRAAPPKGGA